MQRALYAKYHIRPAVSDQQPPQALIDGCVSVEWHEEDQGLSPLSVISDNPL